MCVVSGTISRCEVNDVCSNKFMSLKKPTNSLKFGLLKSATTMGSNFLFLVTIQKQWLFVMVIKISGLKTT